MVDKLNLGEEEERKKLNDDKVNKNLEDTVNVMSRKDEIHSSPLQEIKPGIV